MSAPEPPPRRPLDQPRYFPVSLAKLTVMCLVSFGAYEFYWLYRNWSCERTETRAAVSPFWRTFFAPIWIFSLLTRVREAARAAGVTPAWSPSVVGSAFIVWNLAIGLPAPYWLASALAFIPLLPVQRTIAELNARLAPATPRNHSYSGANLALIVLGAVLWILVIVGLWFAPRDTTERIFARRGTRGAATATAHLDRGTGAGARVAGPRRPGPRAPGARPPAPAGHAHPGPAG